MRPTSSRPLTDSSWSTSPSASASAARESATRRRVEVAGEREGQRERGQQRQRADHQREARRAGLGVGEARIGRRALAVGAVDVGADGSGDAVGGLVDRARDELRGSDAVAALDAREQPRVLVLERLGGGVDRGQRARVVGRGAQGVQARVEDLEIALLVVAQRSVGEHHLRLGEVRVGERGVRVLCRHDPRHDAGRHPLVRALQRVDVDHIDHDDRGRQGEDRAEAEAELDGQAHVPDCGHATGDGRRMAPESAVDARA